MDLMTPILMLTGIVCCGLLVGHIVIRLIDWFKKPVIIGTPIIHPVTKPVVWPPIVGPMHNNLPVLETERVIDSGEFDITDFGSTLTETQTDILGDMQDTLIN